MRAGCWRGSLVGLALLASVAGCQPDGRDDEVRFENEGQVCLEMDHEGRVYVTVRFPTCLSSSCHRPLATMCGVTKAGTVLQVTSRGSYERNGGSDCTDDCGSLTAECDAIQDVGPLEPGEYTLKHGSDTATVTLEPSMQVCAFGG